MNLEEIIQNRIVTAQLISKNARKRLESLPKGQLYCKTTNSKLRYYARLKSSDTNGQYLGIDKEKIIRQLEEKIYLQELIKVSKEEETGLKKIQELINKLPDHNSVFENIPQEKRHLLESHEEKTCITEVNILDELSRPHAKKPISAEKSIVTQNGDMVRSKSEAIIADRLKAAGVPYIYEYPITLCDPEYGITTEIYPDFKVFNVRTGKAYYWEHLGMMDDAKYCAEAITRIEMFAKDNILVGENLIVSSESTKHPLNTKHIDLLIERYLK